MRASAARTRSSPHPPFLLLHALPPPPFCLKESQRMPLGCMRARSSRPPLPLLLQARPLPLFVQAQQSPRESLILKPGVAPQPCQAVPTRPRPSAPIRAHPSLAHVIDAACRSPTCSIQGFGPCAAGKGPAPKAPAKSKPPPFPIPSSLQVHQCAFPLAAPPCVPRAKLPCARWVHLACGQVISLVHR